MLCATVAGGKVLTGCADGHVYVWQDRIVSRLLKGILPAYSDFLGSLHFCVQADPVSTSTSREMVWWEVLKESHRCLELCFCNLVSLAAHDNAVCCLDSSGDVWLSGDALGEVKVWSDSLTVLSSVSLPATIGGPVAITGLSLLIDKQRSSFIVGTAACDVFEVNRMSLKMVRIHGGHSASAVWALCGHPADRDVVVSCGDDRALRMWSMSTHKQVLASAMVRPLCVEWGPGMCLRVCMCLCSWVV